tara:strand:- start:232 stop:387 length:156 start_codon:yes stop_codon:yes gene_type:complete
VTAGSESVFRNGTRAGEVKCVKLRTVKEYRLLTVMDKQPLSGGGGFPEWKT